LPLPVDTGEVVQILVQGEIEGQQCQNVWYFRALAPDPDAIASLFADIAECLLALLPFLSSSYTFVQLKGKIVSPAIGGEAIWQPDPADTVVGQSAGDSLPSHDSVLISLRTVRPGRSGRGRIFIAGVPEGQTTRSLLNLESPLYVALAAFVTCMLGKFHARDVPAPGNYDWGVMSREIGGAKPPFLAAGYATITQATVIRELSTTRSRKLGRGR
jgi:hypothetical protein